MSIESMFVRNSKGQINKTASLKVFNQKIEFKKEQEALLLKLVSNVLKHSSQNSLWSLADAIYNTSDFPDKYDMSYDQCKYIVDEFVNAKAGPNRSFVFAIIDDTPGDEEVMLWKAMNEKEKSENERLFKRQEVIKLANKKLQAKANALRAQALKIESEIAQ